MKQLPFIIILSIFILFGCGKGKKYPYKTTDFRSELKKHLDILAAENELPSKDTTARNFLHDSCTKEELLKILSCENPLLRIISYRTIVNRNEPDFFSILLDHLDDTAKVRWWYYEDAAGDFMVSDLMITKASDKRKLSQSQKDTLIDKVLLKYPYLDNANYMIQSIDSNEKYYTVIKLKSDTKTERCGEQMGASYALAKFRKKEDLKLLKSNFMNNYECSDWAFQSIEIFPDTAFIEVLTNYFETEIKNKNQFNYNDLKYYSRAVAQYKNQNSLQILGALIKEKTYSDGNWKLPETKKYVFRAINKYPSHLYDSLYNELKPQMSSDVLENINKPDHDSW